MTNRINKQEQLAKYEAAKRNTLKLLRVLEDSSCVGRPLASDGQPFDYRPIVEGYLHKPKHN
jgi:hypothetical protein